MVENRQAENRQQQHTAHKLNTRNNLVTGLCPFCLCYELVGGLLTVNSHSRSCTFSSKFCTNNVCMTCRGSWKVAYMKQMSMKHHCWKNPAMLVPRHYCTQCWNWDVWTDKCRECVAICRTLQVGRQIHELEYHLDTNINNSTISTRTCSRANHSHTVTQIHGTKRIHTYIHKQLSLSTLVSNRIKQIGFKMLFKHGKT